MRQYYLSHTPVSYTLKAHVQLYSRARIFSLGHMFYLRPYIGHTSSELSASAQSYPSLRQCDQCHHFTY